MNFEEIKNTERYGDSNEVNYDLLFEDLKNRVVDVPYVKTKSIKKEKLDNLIEAFPIGAIIEDYKEKAPEFGDIIGGDIQIVAVSVTIRGTNAQMSLEFKHPNYQEEDDPDDHTGDAGCLDHD